MLNDPAIHGERITVSDNAKFILSSSNKNFLVLLRSITTGTTKKIRHWQHNMVLFVIPGVVLDAGRFERLNPPENKKRITPNVMLSINFTVGFYEYKATDGVPHGFVNAAASHSYAG